MQYELLGSSDLRVSRVCLGTMTFGIQNTQQDANELNKTIIPTGGRAKRHIVVQFIGNLLCIFWA